MLLSEAKGREAHIPYTVRGHMGVHRFVDGSRGSSTVILLMQNSNVLQTTAPYKQTQTIRRHQKHSYHNTHPLSYSSSQHLAFLHSPTKLSSSRAWKRTIFPTQLVLFSLPNTSSLRYSNLHLHITKHTSSFFSSSQICNHPPLPRPTCC